MARDNILVFKRIEIRYLKVILTVVKLWLINNITTINISDV